MQVTTAFDTLHISSMIVIPKIHNHEKINFLPNRHLKVIFHQVRWNHFTNNRELGNIFEY